MTRIVVKRDKGKFESTRDAETSSA